MFEVAEGVRDVCTNMGGGIYVTQSHTHLAESTVYKPL